MLICLSAEHWAQLLATMAALAPRFLAQHFAADVWPAVRALLTTTTTTGGDGFTHSTSSSRYGCGS
jgi:hypothetical protein